MCDPVTAGVVLQVVGSTGGAVASYQNQQTGAKNLRAQATAQDQKASSIRVAGALAANRIARDAKVLAAEQAGVFAASGVQADSASATNVIASTAEAGASDALAQKYASELAAWEADTQAKYLRADAKRLKQNSLNSLIFGIAGGAGASALALKGRGGSSGSKKV